MPGYDARYWAERDPLFKRSPFPACRGRLTADVVVIGGGLTGAVAACVFARSGLDVIVVEADRVASAATAAGFGLVSGQPSLASFATTRAAIGLRSARLAWQQTRASALDYASAIRRLGIRCDAEFAPLVVNAPTPAAAEILRREQAARKAAGIVAPWQTPSALGPLIGTETGGGIKLADSITIDPVRAAHGFLRVAQRAGARIFERSPVRRTRFDRAMATVVLGDAEIESRAVYAATGRPGPLFPQLRRHVREFETYTVVTEPMTTAMKRETGSRSVVLTEVGDDAPWLRWLADGRAMFTGAAGPATSPRTREKVLVQRTGQLMYELSVRYPVVSGLRARWSWPTPIVATADGLPWIGTHRNHPHHFFALALGTHGEAYAWFAAKAALRHFSGGARREDGAFAFTR